MRSFLALPAVGLASCNLIDTDASAQCEDWIKSEIAKPESYSWSGTNWQTDAEAVTITFTSDVNGVETTQFAFCDYDRRSNDSLLLKPKSSSIELF